MFHWLHEIVALKYYLYGFESRRPPESLQLDPEKVTIAVVYGDVTHIDVTKYVTFGNILITSNIYLMSMSHIPVRQNKHLLPVYMKIKHIYTVTLMSLLAFIGLSDCGGGGSSGGTRNVGPVVTNTSPATIDEGTEATLNVEATDSDGSIREIRRLQLFGPNVSFTNGTSSITFQVPEVDMDTDISILSVAAVDDVGVITSVEMIHFGTNSTPPLTNDALSTSRIAGTSLVSGFNYSRNIATNTWTKMN